MVEEQKGEKTVPDAVKDLTEFLRAMSGLHICRKHTFQWSSDMIYARKLRTFGRDSSSRLIESAQITHFGLLLLV